MTRIGEPVKEIEVIPRPIRVPRPVPSHLPRKEPEPVFVPLRGPSEGPSRIWNRAGMTVEEIPYACPICGRVMEMEDGVLYCPQHGMIYVG